MPRRTLEERKRNIGILMAGVSSRNIAFRFHSAKSTMNHLIPKYDAHQTVTDLPDRGGPQKTTQEDETMVNRHAQQPFWQNNLKSRPTPKKGKKSSMGLSFIFE